MKTRLLTGLAAVLTLALVSWGVTGHRTVARIAENHLTDKARQGIHQLIGDTSLADISTFADEVRGQRGYEATGPWHFLNIRSGYSYEHFAAIVAGMQQPNVYSMTLKCYNDLKSDTTSKPYRVMALKFLVHLVGDMHQPMHVSHAEDQGGNLIQVLFNNQPTNLHSLWDTRLLEHRPVTMDMRVAEYDNATPEQIARWQQDTVMQWLYESYAISEQIYVSIGKNPRLNEDYYITTMPIVRKRILQGGVRLAGLLNDIYK